MGEELVQQSPLLILHQTLGQPRVRPKETPSDLSIVNDFKKTNEDVAIASQKRHYHQFQARRE